MSGKEIDFMNRFNKSVTNFTYSRGYVRSDDDVYIRCKKCGMESNRSGGFLRKAIRGEKTITCRYCVGDRLDISKPRKIESKHCKECNYLYDSSNGSIYCSSRCKYKNRNRRIEFKRRIRMSAGVFDSSINIDKLFVKDNGGCYLCKKQCNKQDYIISEQGHFIVGMNYPTIDHVKPLSKGGTHSWDNVRLSCFRCNVLKGNKEFNGEELQLSFYF